MFIVQQAEVDMSKVGVGVTKEAQYLFDVLVRTVPCTWNGKSICVMDSVMIEPPYLIENVSRISGHPAADSTFDRVKQVLPVIRSQLGLS